MLLPTQLIRNCKNALAEVFSEGVVNQGLWPSRLSDVYPCEFCLCCALKQIAPCQNTRSLREGNIRYSITETSPCTWTHFPIM